MDLFTNLTADQQKLLIRLPYRVGLWVSHADETGGETADEQELVVLHSLIISYAQDFCKSEFVQYLMTLTVQQTADWKNWHEDIDHVEDECKQAISILSSALLAKELNAFKGNLIEIGYSVAMAYREFDDDISLSGRTKTYIALWAERVKVFFSGQAMQSHDEMLNVSEKEHEVLAKLTEALDSPVRETLTVNG